MLNKKNYSDEYFMKIAYKEAEKAFKKDEVPVGAIVVDNNNKIIAKAHNLTEKKKNPSMHAEMLAIKKACKRKKSKRLTSCRIYVTLEPCAMCSAAISFARFHKLIIGATDEKGGAVLSGIKFFATNSCFHIPEVDSGIYEKKCSQILKDFFKSKR